MEGKIRIRPEAYHYQGLWKCSLLADWFWAAWLVPEYAKEVELPLQDGGVFVIHGGNFFTKKTTLNAIRAYAKDIIDTKDNERLALLRAQADRIYKEYIAKAESLRDAEPSQETVHQMAEAGRHIMFPWCLGFLMSEIFDEFLIPAAKMAGVPEEEISTLIPKLDTPLESAHARLQELKALLESKGYWDLLLEDAEEALTVIRRDTELSQAIDAYAREYGWTTIMNLDGDDPTFEEVIDQITHLSTDKKEEVARELSGDLSFLVECATTTAYLRQSGVEYFSIYSRPAKALFGKVAEELGLSYRELLDLNLLDIEAGLSGADVRPVVERHAGDWWAIYTSPDGGEPVVIDDREEVEQLMSTMIPKAEKNDGDTIVGQTANKGIARGRVKIILANEDFHKMETGDILVTTMTTPNFVPLMQRSAAIVTDIGGMLCHAAIISREINIPCVIGTKVATQVLQDGDVVEVDATKGEVRVIEGE